MGNSNLLFESIFKRKLSEAGTGEFLSKITIDYPYFSPAQFFLLLRTEKGTEEYHSLAAKAAVHFNNVHWLQFQLQETNQDAEELTDASIADAGSFVPVFNQQRFSPQNASDESTDDQPKYLEEEKEEKSTSLQNAETLAVDAAASLSADETLKEENGERQDNEVIYKTGILQGEPTKAATSAEIPELYTTDKITSEQQDKPDGIIAERGTSTASTGAEELSQPADEISPARQEPIHLSLPKTAEDPAAENNITEPLVDKNIASGEQNIADGSSSENNILPEVADLAETANNENEFTAEAKKGTDTQELNVETHTSIGSETPGETVGIHHSGHFNNDNSPLVNEPEAEDETGREQEIEPMNFKLNIDTSSITEKDIIFEPLHTSDYFASLGIKLSDEIKPSDKLGKQLKSFTEWLKTMKKVHSDVLPPISGQADMTVQKLAEQSNKEDAVLTEAMADVLLQQGKAEKAIELYKKLSLLNPSKSTYFAAKIDQLKEH